MRPIAATLIIACPALLLTACSLSTTAGGSSASSSPASAPATSAPASPAAGQSGQPTSLDPCQLVTASEASSLAGTSFASGTEQSSGNGKQCVYGSQTLNVFMVEVGQGDSAATARQDWAQQKARAQSMISQKLPSGMGLSVHTQQVSGLADRAETVYGTASIAGQKISLSGIYLLKGATFLAYEDLVVGHAAPSSAAMEAEAHTALGRVP